MSRDSIKMVAMLTMLINHIANVFLPAGQPLTNLCLCIGYFTAVTMCFFLVEGYGCTRSKRRYAGRLLGFAVLAQLPYQLAFPANGIAGFVQFNMLFTLLLCFLVLLVQEKIRDRVLRGVCIVLLICASLFCDWALLAPVFTLLFAWAGGNRTRQKAAFGAAALLYGGMAGLGSGQVWEAVGCAVPILVSAFVILYLYNGRRAARGRTFYKWFFYAFYPAHLLVLAALVGCVVGPLGGAFGLALNWANATRGAHPWLLYLLPVAGLVIVFLYHRFDPDGGGSTNQIFVSVREHKPLTLRTAPLIFVSTVATHLFGGSSGREGAALLLGGSVSGQLGRALRLENRDCRLMTMCGMAGAFSAIFGTPLAATIFTLEVVDVGSMQYAALLPCLVSALLGVFISGKMGLAPEAFVLQAEAAPTPDNLVRVIILGALLAALSIFFCELLHVTPKLYRKFFPNIYLRVAAGGVLIIALTKLLGTTDYNGAGAAVIEAAIDGEAVPYAFLLKMLFTALTLGAGFKGGEIVPIFFTGATFGCVAAPLLGLPPQLGAALGMVALFCGCTNSPLASICLAIEVFGGQCVSLFALACAVSYMLSSYFSLYREQHFLHSKLRIVGVQRVHGHWSETDAAHLTTNDDGEN